MPLIETSSITQLRAIALDLDDTIVLNTATHCHIPRWRHAADSSIKAVSSSFIGLSDEQWQKVAEHSFGFPQTLAVERMAAAIQEITRLTVSTTELVQHGTRYLDHISASSCHLAPGVEKFLVEARRANIPVGIATSSGSEFVWWIVKNLGLADYVDAIVAADHPLLEGNLKPGPGPWRLLWDIFSVTPDDAVLVVEDNLQALCGALHSHSRVCGVLIAQPESAYASNMKVLRSLGLHKQVINAQDFNELRAYIKE